jgi:serine/threonine-protein kinase HipA
MTLNGKRDAFLTTDLLAAASAADLKPPKAKAILREVHAAVAAWQTHATAAGVPAAWLTQIQPQLRLDLGP